MEFTISYGVSQRKRRLLPLRLKVSAMKLSRDFLHGGSTIERCPPAPRVELKVLSHHHCCKQHKCYIAVIPSTLRCRSSVRSLSEAQPGAGGSCRPAGRARTARGRRTAAGPGPAGQGGRVLLSRFSLQNGSLLQLQCNMKRGKPTKLTYKVEAPQYLMQNRVGNIHFLFSLEKNAVARRLLPLSTACQTGLAFWEGQMPFGVEDFFPLKF